MDNNDYGQNYTYDRGTYYSVPRWNDFTIDDERRAKKRFSRFFLATFFFLLISNIAALIVELGILFFFGQDAYIGITKTSWYMLTLNTFCMYGLAFPAFFLIIMRMKKTVRAKRSMKFSELFKIFLIAEAFLYVGSLVGNYLNLFLGSFIGNKPTNAVSDLVSNSNIWLLIPIVVIIGPIVEEFIFRKFLMDRLGMYGDRLAIFVSAIAFGLFHCNLYQFFYAMLLGLILAYMYSKTSNVWYPIGLHMIINFLGSVIPILLEDGTNKLDMLSKSMMTAEQNTDELIALATDPSVYLASTYLSLQIAMVVAGVILFFKSKRRIFISDRCEVCIPKNRRSNVIFGNPGVILFLVISGILMTVSLVL